MQKLLEDEGQYRALKTTALARYGDDWLVHLEEVKGDRTAQGQLLERGKQLKAEIDKLDERIRGISMTPKHLRADRLAQFSAERKQLIGEFLAVKSQFHKAASAAPKQDAFAA